MVILLVCSGNTCRSPLAAAMLAAKLTAIPPQVEMRIFSLGTAVMIGTPASEGSYLVGLERGIDLSAHRAQAITPEFIEAADLILTMSNRHLEHVQQMGGGTKVHTIGEFAGEHPPRDVPDPWGGDLAGYRAVADLLDPMLDKVATRLREYTPQ